MPKLIVAAMNKILSRLAVHRSLCIAVSRVAESCELAGDLPPELEVRLVDPDELPIVLDNPYPGSISSPRGYYEKLMQRGALLAVVFENGTPIAWKFAAPHYQDFWGWVRLDTGPSSLVLIAAYTAPQGRRRKLQLALSKALARKARDMGFEWLSWVYEQDNTSTRELSLRMNYKDVGRIEGREWPLGIRQATAAGQTRTGRYSQARRCIMHVDPAQAFALAEGD